jgi:hypothetical protein
VKPRGPAKPLRLATVIISVPEEPTVMTTVVEVGVRLKSGSALTVMGSQALVTPLLLASPLYAAFQLKDPAAVKA